jgi:hypothetical protein
MRENDSPTPLTLPSTGLSGTRFSTLKSAGINDPEESENIATLKTVKAKELRMNVLN